MAAKKVRNKPFNEGLKTNPHLYTSLGFLGNLLVIRKDDFAPCLWTVLASEAEPELSGATCAELNSRSNNERMSLGIHTVQVQVFDLHIHVRFCQVP